MVAKARTDYYWAPGDSAWKRPGHSLGGSASPYPAVPDMPAGWAYAFDIPTDANPGVTYTTGVRTTDSAYNRAAQASWGVGPDSDALMITSEYTGGTIYSADIKFQESAHVLAPQHAVRYCAKFGPHPDLGPDPSKLVSGYWMGAWERPSYPGTDADGDGEYDGPEVFGSIVNTYGTWHRDDYARINYISNTYTATVQKPTNMSLYTHGIDPSGWHYYTLTKTLTDYNMYVDGLLVSTISRATYSNQAYWDRGAGDATQTWYYRFTAQIGLGTSATAGGPIDTANLPLYTTVRDIQVFTPA